MMSLYAIAIIVAISSKAIAIRITGVENISTNVDIPCDLHQPSNPLYWKIQDKIYDLDTIPEIFTVRGHGALTLQNMDRRMNGWRFQCFTLGPNNENYLNPALITDLTVVYDQTTEGPSEDPSLLEPFLNRGLFILYQTLITGEDILTFGWIYTRRNHTLPCVLSNYKVSIYSQENIDSSTSQRDLMALRNTETATETVSIPSHFIDGTYFRVSAVSSDNSVCEASVYFHSFQCTDCVGRNITVGLNNTSASFEIPDVLRNDRSLQLIWSKQDSTQCVCPPVEELLSQCACNIGIPNINTISISGHTLVISNLAAEMGKGEVSVHFVSSVSSGCNSNCNLRTTKGVYRFIFLSGFPQPPVVEWFDQNSTFCFSAPAPPIIPEHYEVDLRDNTGSLTRLNYDTTRCLLVISDLFPYQCGPFQLSVTAINTVGRETTSFNATATACDCYQQIGATVRINDVTTDSAEFKLTCQNETVNVTVTIKHDGAIAKRLTLPCNSTGAVKSLQASTNYTINAESVGCVLEHFRTKSNRGNDNARTIAGSVLGVVAAIGVVIVIIVTICNWLLATKTKL